MIAGEQKFEVVSMEDELSIHADDNEWGTGPVIPTGKAIKKSKLNIFY